MIPIVSYLPDNIIHNDDFKNIYKDWNSDRVFEQTGIISRHYAKENELTSDIAKKAIDKLIDAYNIDKKAIDFIICITETPDNMLPATACKLQDICGLPKSCGAFDINMGCSGFTYGIMTAKQFVFSGIASNIMVVTVDTLSKLCPIEDRGIKTLIGDAACAVLINKDNISSIGNFIYGTDGSGYDNIIVKEKDNNKKENALFMNGIEVFSFAISEVPNMIKDILDKNNLTMEDIDFVILHQANKTILEYIKKRLKLDNNKFYINMKYTGNTAGSTIPLALDDLNKQGKLKNGMKILLLGFGVGLSWCGTIVEW